MTADYFNSCSNTADFIDIPGLSLGMLLQIQFEGLGSSKSRLIGLDHGNFIIVQTPPLANIGSKLYEKNHGIIRYLFSGHVYAFRCTMLSLIKEPYRLCIFSYPKSVEKVNLRKHERLSCIIAAEINLKGATYEGIVSNISMGGCSFEFSRSTQQEFPDVKVSEEIIIALQLAGLGCESTVHNATIRGVHMDKMSLTLGLQFTASEFKESDPKSERELGEYLSTLQNS